MPHKIYPDTMIQPTRYLVLEVPSRVERSLNRRWYEQRYIQYVDTKMIGTYNHYKIKSLDPERFEEGYELGDIERPDEKQHELKDYSKDHAKVIQDHFTEIA